MLFRKDPRALTVYIQPAVAIVLVVMAGALLAKVVGIEPSSLGDLLRAAITVAGLRP